MAYLIKVYQYKSGTTRKPKQVDDALIEGREVGLNKTCVTHTLKDATQERAQAFVTEWLDSPLGLTKTVKKRLQDASQQFINSGIKDIKFLEGYSKKKNRVEIYLQSA